jgi:DNA-binding MarR family transcriptional regulator
MLIGSGTPPEPMGQFTGFLLNWVAAQTRGAFAETLEELGLRPPHFATLVMIDASPGLAQQDLVAAIHIDPSTMVALVDDLERAGLAERRPHPSDRRKRALHLTPAGERTLTAAREAAGELTHELFGALDPDERTELHRLLRKLAGYAEMDSSHG